MAIRMITIGFNNRFKGGKVIDVIMDLKFYEGKKVYVKLNSQRVYSGIIEEVTYMGKDNFGVEIWLLSMTDKFGQKLSFSNKEISLIEEEKKEMIKNSP